MKAVAQLTATHVACTPILALEGIISPISEHGVLLSAYVTISRKVFFTGFNHYTNP